MKMRASALAVWIGVLAASPAISAAQTPAMAASSASVADVAKMQAELDRLLGTLRQQVASLPRGSPERADKARQLAGIEKQLRDQSRVRYVSPGTQGRWKAYDATVSSRVEQQGEAHFPTVDGQNIYGRLVVNLTIDRDGHVIGVEVAHSSGNAALDQQAKKIALDAGPFEAFDAAMRKDADQVVITAPFNFHHQH
jgi:protein TonB